jgi:GT2 family glycosyltransferase
MNSGISIVIPNYNGKEILKRNIPSVYHALKTSGISDYEIIIADDASSDDSAGFIRSEYPEIILIENSTNKGFGGNINSGIVKATKDLVMLLNNDVVLTGEYFINLLHYFDKPDTFGVMSRIVGIDSDKIQDGAKYPGYSFGSISPNKNYISSTKSSLYSYYLSGANALVDRKKLIELGGFDEIFNPFYLEDVDLGLRAWRLGYKCYYEHNAICRHPGSSTIKKEFNKKVRIISKRNKMILHFIHLSPVELLFFFLLLTFKTIFRLLILDFNYLKSYWLFLRSINKCRQSRSALRITQNKKHTHLSLSDIVTFITKSIPDNDVETF